MSPLCTQGQYAVGFVVVCVLLGALMILATYLDNRRQ
jgi:hypothetical protein